MVPSSYLLPAPHPPPTSKNQILPELLSQRRLKRGRGEFLKPWIVLPLETNFSPRFKERNVSGVKWVPVLSSLRKEEFPDSWI